MTVMPKKIVVIGGGTGTHTVLSGLKKYPADVVDLVAIVTVADSGGSTGRLRDEFGVLPVGDFRMALVGLAEEKASSVMRKLFLYRFSKGEGLEGHNFGNLFLTALTDILGSEEKAIEYASRILRVRGRVLPVTVANINLVAEYEHGLSVYGESNIDEPSPTLFGRKITAVRVEPEAIISPHAKKEIESADLIVLGPGDLHTSILPNIVVGGVAEAIRTSSAKKGYIMNLMTKRGQTEGFTASDYVSEMEKYLGIPLDYILTNTTAMPADMVNTYQEAGEGIVVGNMQEDKRIIAGDFLSSLVVQKKEGDSLKRSLLRHDPEKLATALMKLL